MSDAIDRVVGLLPEDALALTRRQRPEFVIGAEQCLQSVLAPQNDQGLTIDLRLALALRIATLNNDSALQQDYQTQLAQYQLSESLQALARGDNNLDEPLATLARHSDLVTQSPAQATELNIRLLEQAGFNNPQIVALSELIAFVNFQTRVITGLRLLRSS